MTVVSLCAWLWLLSRSIHALSSSTHTTRSALSQSLEELSASLGGRGRALQVWEAYRKGLEPELGQQASALYHVLPPTTVSLLQSTTANDGTTKLLLELKDQLQVETVLIPWHDRQATTLCVSSQVGCAQACTFCQTGRMGKLRSLSVDEILVQVWFAQQQTLYPIDNVVFMGMGEPADNADAVVEATRILTHPQQFQLAPRKVTISTVAPTPEAFLHLGKAPAVLAWSVHASRDDLRRALVPTTKYTMEELRDGLVQALLGRSRKMRATLLEVTLLDDLNDGPDDAAHLADFCHDLIALVPGMKLVVNLIPWNDIGAAKGPARLYRPPTQASVLAFQKVLVKAGLLCYIRTTRGDDQRAACGQLATQRP